MKQNETSQRGKGYLSLYYISFAIYAFVYHLGHTKFETLFFISVDSWYDLGRLICAVLLIVKLSDQRFGARQLLLLTAGVVVISIAFYVTRDWNLVLLFLFIIAGDNISVKRLASIAFCVGLIVLLLAVIFAHFGVIETRYTIRMTDGVMRLRSAMGFSHPNQFGQLVLSVCLAWMVVQYPRIRIRDYIIYSLAGLICSSVADSKTSVYCIILAIALFTLACLSHRYGYEVPLAFVCLIAFVVSAGLSYYMMVRYDSGIPWMSDLNGLLSTRFSLGKWYWEHYPPTMFGRRIGTFIYETSQYTQYGPDNAYVRLLLQDGRVITILFLGTYAATFFSFFRHRRFDTSSLVLALYAVVAIMEANSLHFAMNYGLVAASVVLYGMNQYAEANAVPSLETRDNIPKSVNVSRRSERSISLE